MPCGRLSLGGLSLGSRPAHGVVAARVSRPRVSGASLHSSPGPPAATVAARVPLETHGPATARLVRFHMLLSAFPAACLDLSRVAGLRLPFRGGTQAGEPEPGDCGCQVWGLRWVVIRVIQHGVMPSGSSPVGRPTHEVTLFDAGSGERRVVPVRLESGIAYAFDRKRGLVDTRWRCDGHSNWIFPGVEGTPLARRISPGSEPRDGTPSRPLAIRVSDRERTRWIEAARRAGQDVSTWLRRAAERAAAEPEKARLRPLKKAPNQRGKRTRSKGKNR